MKIYFYNKKFNNVIVKKTYEATTLFQNVMETYH